MIVKRVVSVFKAGGIGGVLRAIARRIRNPRARSFPECRDIVAGATGIDIGGPSPLFARGGMLPVYPLAMQVDNVNFARRTIWEGAIDEGDSFTFHPGKAPGRQFIAEGSDLHTIPAASYDFVLSSHMLEHTANPLRALAEWRRLLRPGGALIVVVPHRDGTFDHRRPVTTMQHLVEDFERGIGEDDLTCVDEILRLHDASMDPGVHDITFRERAERNAELRSLHHHVFDTRLLMDAVSRAGFDLLSVEPLEPYHIVVIARKPDGASVGPPVADEWRASLRRSPFRTDRQNA